MCVRPQDRRSDVDRGCSSRFDLYNVASSTERRAVSGVGRYLGADISRLPPEGGYHIAEQFHVHWDLRCDVEHLLGKKSAVVLLREF
jgi:hypothetical protein